MNLKQETEASVCDKVRLDWLEANFQQHSFRYVPGWPTMNNSRQGHWAFWCYSEGTTNRPTLREAIDAAMACTPESSDQNKA